MLRGGSTNGHWQMPKYIYMLGIVYPNWHIRMHKSPENEFIFLYLLHPLMRDFEFCRPVVVVNVAHLSEAYRGTFVSASTFDGAGISLNIWTSLKLFINFILKYSVSKLHK